jgi:hypothetical protein
VQINPGTKKGIGRLVNPVFARLLTSIAAFAAAQFAKAVIDELKQIEQRVEEKKKQTVLPKVLKILQGGKG